MFHLLYALKSGLCPLASVQPRKQKSIHVRSSAGSIPRGSLVRLEPWSSCKKNTVRAKIISQVYFYQKSRRKLAAHETSICLSLEDLQPIDNRVLYPLHPPPDDMGMVWEGIGFLTGDTTSCGQNLKINNQHYDELQLAWVQSLDRDSALILLALQQKWFQDYGEWILGRIWVNDWKRVSLPLSYHSYEEIQQEHKRESLRNRKQKSKAVIAHGPQNTWLHFLGTDALFSDVWGPADHIQQFIDITTLWHTQCLKDPQIYNTSSCTTQIGDISWYNDTRPDPLGHKTHYRGTCVDIRLFRSDASRYESFWNREDDRKGRKKAYSLYMNQKYISLLQEENMQHILFGDPRIDVSSAPKHDDHIHFCLPPQAP